ncbi:MAG: toxin-antitoxin system HicB family antitoxin [Nitrospinales bacterium]
MKEQASRICGVFEKAVDDYLNLCTEMGREPEKIFRGIFNVRTGPALHREAVMFARRTGASLNTVAVEALKKYIQTKPRKPRKTERD